MNYHIEVEKMKKSICLKDLCEEWVRIKKPTTASTYSYLLESLIIGEIGTLKLQRITDTYILDYLNKLESRVSITRLKQVINVLNALFNYAREKGYKMSVKHKIIVPRYEVVKNDVEVFTELEQVKIEQYLFFNTNPDKFVVLLCLYTGIRIGEACGLKHGDFDLNNNCIHINRTVQRVKNFDKNLPSKTAVIVTSPKSKTSMRNIPLPEFIVKLYKQVYPVRESGDFLCTNSEKVTEPRTLQRKFKKMLTLLKINDKNFHVLRHTFATNAIIMGFDLKSLSEILGHSNVMFTMKIYVHSSFLLKLSNMQKMEKLYKQHLRSQRYKFYDIVIYISVG